jgi:hypothetical protein
VTADDGLLHPSTHLAESLKLQRRLGNRRGIALKPLNLGVVALDRRRPKEATQRLREVLAIFRGLGAHRIVAPSLALLGVAATDERDCASAARLLGKGSR